MVQQPDYFYDLKVESNQKVLENSSTLKLLISTFPSNYTWPKQPLIRMLYTNCNLFYLPRISDSAWLQSYKNHWELRLTEVRYHLSNHLCWLFFGIFPTIWWISCGSIQFDYWVNHCLIHYLAHQQTSLFFQYLLKHLVLCYYIGIYCIYHFILVYPYHL